jgi:hypothetical protein
MAITMKSDPEKGWQTMALFDVDQSLIAQAKKHGIQCVQTTPGTFVVKNALQTFGTVAVKGTALTLAQQKALGPNSKIAFKTNFESALKKGIDASPLKTQAMPTKDDPFGDSEFEDVPQPEPKNYKPYAPAMPATPKVPASEFKKSSSWSSDIPKLIEAKNVYDGVQGTNAGSIYYVFAMFPGLNMAARIKGSKLSVRAEGHKLDDYAPHLVHDFKMDKSNGYISAHYTINEGASLIIKTLGAMVGTLGFGKALKVADLEKFVKEQA